MASENVPVTVSALAGALSGLGLRRGDSVIVHSSLRSLGRMENGADGVLDALLEVLGPDGNLVLPTFNYTRPAPEPCFDPEMTPGRTGIIPETGRRRPGALRSDDPTHSVAAIGPGAAALTAGHLETRTFGRGSPLDRLAAMGGKVLLLGVGQTSNSTVHVGEEHAGTPKASWYEEPPLFRTRLPGGRVAEKRLDTSPSCSSAFEAVEYPLRRNGEIAEARAGGAHLRLMAGAAVISRVVEIIADRPDILLCRWPGCRPCAGARANLREAGRIS